MQARQDYLTAVLHMVSLLQESTVQRLYKIECNYFKKKKKVTSLCPWVFGKYGNSLSFLSRCSSNHFGPLKAPYRDITEGLRLDSCLFD